MCRPARRGMPNRPNALRPVVADHDQVGRPRQHQLGDPAPVGGWEVRVVMSSTHGDPAVRDRPVEQVRSCPPLGEDAIHLAHLQCSLHGRRVAETPAHHRQRRGRGQHPLASPAANARSTVSCTSAGNRVTHGTTHPGHRHRPVRRRPPGMPGRSWSRRRPLLAGASGTITSAASATATLRRWSRPRSGGPGHGRPPGPRRCRATGRTGRARSPPCAPAGVPARAGEGARSGQRNEEPEAVGQQVLAESGRIVGASPGRHQQVLRASAGSGRPPAPPLGAGGPRPSSIDDWDRISCSSTDDVPGALTSTTSRRRDHRHDAIPRTAPALPGRPA